jgi:UDP-N-acetylglucosamine--N-acetylmuramyl-(pentapeptide) pyrophosphoryl-undecaprenol N-acetylglucosamine transferase
LARDLIAQGCAVRFVGAHLGKSRCFYKELFSFDEIASSNRTPWRLLQGVCRSIRLARAFRPQIAIGFGSYHAFPAMLAARLLGIPLVVFESNAVPGKVNRFFAKGAAVAAVQFSAAAAGFKERSAEVALPLWSRPSGMTRAEARRYFALQPDRTTLLVCGGSQGARAINRVCGEAASALCALQVIHLAGTETEAEEVSAAYRRAGVTACVKAFETCMEAAWRASDVAVCRAGAATLAELLVYAVPAVLVPYPHAADDHQAVNAAWFAQQAGGGCVLAEEQLGPETLQKALFQCLECADAHREALAAYQARKALPELATLIREMLA